MKTAILFSGGLDSTSLMYWKRPDLALFINYGQVCLKGELAASKQICNELEIPLSIINIGNFKNIFRANRRESPTTINDKEWIPFRNQLLLTSSAIKSIELGVDKILIGSVKSDKYKDGSECFINKINDLISYQEGHINVLAPAIQLTTTQLIMKSKIKLPLLSWCHSCTQSNFACGACDSCNKHRMVFSELGFNEY